jgi:small subunit ribosomal protein S4
MSRYRGPRLRITRRLGDLPGLARKSSAKTNPPGQHGASRSKSPSQYSIRLKEKQKLRFNYGVNETQLIRYVKKARRMKGSTGEILLQLLEMRLDTIVFRGGFAPTLRASRQLVSHGHISVNMSGVNIPSYQCKPGDKISFKNSLGGMGRPNQLASLDGALPVPSHLKFDLKTLSGEVKQIVSKEEVSCSVNELLIIEYYSRKC